MQGFFSPIKRRPSTLRSVKALRVLLLILLSLVVPMRGAVAAAMVCPAPVATVHGVSDVVDMTRDSAMADDDDEHTCAQTHDHGACTKAQCEHCCGALPLISVLPALAADRRPVATTFPSLAVPTACFLSSGLDRPPRHI